LIGCGTIGRHLAEYLAKSGAGTGPDGLLRLVDSDLLQPENIGRHLLGYQFLLQNKATACTAFLKTTLMGVNIEARETNAMRMLATFESYDLIIDATGEEIFSDALNDLMVDAVRDGKEMPPVIYVYLKGNGGAAQALFWDEAEFACYRCLHVKKDGEWKADPIPREHRAKRVAGGCADGPHIHFPISASVHAAALGLEMALDWVNGAPGHRLRTRRIDVKNTYNIADMDLRRTKDCPACMRT
jgi:molybdopterin/thiamine biosynthesis adenylyltransferase